METRNVFKIAIFLSVLLCVSCTDKVSVTLKQLREATEACAVNGGVKETVVESYFDSMLVYKIHVTCINGAKFEIESNSLKYAKQSVLRRQV